MKKIIIVLALIAVAAAPLIAQNVTEDKEIKTLSGEPLVGRAKLGVLVGVPFSVTFGYRFSNWFEGNLLVGWSPISSTSVAIGANGLFTLFNIPAGETVMPFSLGPQIVTYIGSSFAMDIVADIRLEYTFVDIPLNLFAEIAPGVRFNFTGGTTVTWALLGGIGVRYVF